MTSLPETLELTLDTRWPNRIGVDAVRHSESAYSCVLLDGDWCYFVFRVSLSLDGRWSIIPIAGFEEPVKAVNIYVEETQI